MVNIARSLLICIILTLVCCGDEPEAPRIEVNIIRCSRDSGGSFLLEYTIRNVGNVRFDYYMLWFWVTLQGGATYEAVDEGLGMEPGMGKTAWVPILMGTAPVESSRVVRYRIYDWDNDVTWNWYTEEYRGDSKTW